MEMFEILEVDGLAISESIRNRPTLTASRKDPFEGGLLASEEVSCGELSVIVAVEQSDRQQGVLEI